MADTFTPNFDFVLPEIGGSPDTWGNKLNSNFSEIDSALAANAAAVAAVVPSGIITMWSGAVSAVPAGWALCDGSNGTPDLRDRFVVGAGGEYGVGDTGGAANVTLTTAQIPAHNHTTNDAGSHSHTGTANSAGSHSHSGTASSAGAHTHSVPHLFSNEGAGSDISGKGSGAERTTSTRSAGSHSHSLSINSNGAHTHSLSINNNGTHKHTVNNTGGGNSHENRPPYYALAYIMRLAP